MDTSGNIKRFEHLMDAKAAGFETALSETQAELLAKLEAGGRNIALAKMRQEQYLQAQKEANYDGYLGRNGRRVAKKKLASKPAHKYR